MHTDEVGQPIYFLDAPQPAKADADISRDMFLDSASEAFGPEVATLLTDRVEALIQRANSLSSPLVLACVRNTYVGRSFEIAVVGNGGQDILNYPIPAGISDADACECMQSMIALTVGVSGGVTDMLVNQILCMAHPDPLSALKKS